PEDVQRRCCGGFRARIKPPVVPKVNRSLGWLGLLIPGKFASRCVGGTRMTKMHLPPPSVEPERHSAGFVLVVLLFSVTAAVVVFFFLKAPSPKLTTAFHGGWPGRAR